MSDTNGRSAKKKKQSNKKAVLLVIILFMAAVFMAMYLFNLSSKEGADVETVMIGTAEQKTDITGYIIRNEAVLNAPESGVISLRADEGERVSKGSLIAVIYSGDVSDEVKSELSSIHQRISEIEGSSVEKNLYAGDAVGGAAQVENDIEMITRAVYSGDVSGITHYKDDIIRIIRTNTAEGEQTQTTLEKLRSRKTELEGNISGKTTPVYSSGAAGVMCSRLDGCEDYFNIANIDSITPDYLDEAPTPEESAYDSVEKDKPCIKVINNYEWYLAATVDEVWAEDMKTGHSVKIRFTDISEETVDGTVYSMSEPVDGKLAIVVKSRNMFPGMYTSRIVNAQIIRETYKGFKVSKNAVHIDGEGNYFVYINSEGARRRRDVKILYSDDAYVIIKVDNSATNNLLLYDEVIVSHKGGEKQ